MYDNKYAQAAHDNSSNNAGHSTPSVSDVSHAKLAKVGKDRLRILIPATQRDINMCKTIMTMHALGYPTPTLIGYEEKIEDGGTAAMHNRGRTVTD